MIKAKGLTELIALICWSDYLKLQPKEAVLSAMIKAKVESGKTSYLEQFRENDGIVTITDCTAYGLLNKKSDFQLKLIRGEIKRIIIPDLINVTTRKYQTVNNLFNFLKDFCSPDGVGVIANYALTFAPLPGQENIKGGILTTIAHQDYDRVRRQMAQQGLLSRLLMVSYEYSDDLAWQILRDIAHDKYDWSPIRLNFPDEKQEVSMPGILAERLIPLAEHIGKRLEGYGFRAEHQLKVLAKCCALSEGRQVVANYDVERVTNLALCYLGMENKMVDTTGEVQISLEDETIRQRIVQDRLQGPLFDYPNMPLCFQYGVCTLLKPGEKGKVSKKKRPDGCDPDRCINALAEIKEKDPGIKAALSWQGDTGNCTIAVNPNPQKHR